MSPSIRELDASTEEELRQALAGLLAHAREEVLNDAEVQEFPVGYAKRLNGVARAPWLPRSWPSHSH